MINTKQWMSRELAASVREQAWRDRTTISALVRDVLTDYLENGSEANLAPVDVPSHETRLTYKVPDDMWAQVKERASNEGVSIAGLIRRGLVARTAGVSV